MYIIIRLICENLSKEAVKLSFRKGRKHNVYAAASIVVSVKSYYLREKGSDLTQSNDKRPYTHRKIKKAT